MAHERSFGFFQWFILWICSGIGWLYITWFLLKTNTFFFCGSIWLSRFKIIYYNLFSQMYGFVGSCAHLAMVNSSWTQTHIEKLWKIPHRTKRVYPPCDTSGLQVLILCIFFCYFFMELCYVCLCYAGFGSKTCILVICTLA